MRYVWPVGTTQRSVHEIRNELHTGDILRDSIGVAAFHYLLYKAVPEYRPALALLRIYMYTMNQRAPGTALDNMLREIYANAWRNMHHEYSEKTMQEKFFA